MDEQSFPNHSYASVPNRSCNIEAAQAILIFGQWFHGLCIFYDKGQHVSLVVSTYCKKQHVFPFCADQRGPKISEVNLGKSSEMCYQILRSCPLLKSRAVWIFRVSPTCTLFYNHCLQYTEEFYWIKMMLWTNSNFLFSHVTCHVTTIATCTFNLKIHL